MKGLKNKIILSLLCLMISLAIVACGAKSEQYDKGVSENNGTSNDMIKPEEKSDGTGTNADGKEIVERNNTITSNSNRKLIKIGNIELETLKFDECINGLNDEINKMGGYIESSNIQGKTIGNINASSRYASFTIRIPSDKFDIFLNGLGNIGNILSSGVSGEDITNQYMDTEARVKSLKIQEERLLELLKNAKELKDIIELEKRLSEIRYEIEGYTGSLKHWDSLVNYSTINIGIHEVSQLSIDDGNGTSFGNKINVAFQKSIRNLINLAKSLIVVLIASIPYLFIIIPIILIIRWIIRKYNIKFRNRN